MPWPLLLGARPKPSRLPPRFPMPSHLLDERSESLALIVHVGLERPPSSLGGVPVTPNIPRLLLGRAVSGALGLHGEPAVLVAEVGLRGVLIVRVDPTLQFGFGKACAEEGEPQLRLGRSIGADSHEFQGVFGKTLPLEPVSYTHLTLPTIYSV